MTSIKYQIAAIAVFLFSLPLLLSTHLLLPTASAHLFGQPPFFRINGVYSNFYSVPMSSISDFPIPQDQAPSNYVVNTLIHFNFDVNRLPAPPDVVAKTKFTWDFGDGGKGEGLAQTHTYTKIGSYVLTVYADDGTTPEPQIIESVMINILPNATYQLPKAVITINGVPGKSISDTIHLKLGQTLHLDSSASTDPSSKIISYLWDLGDQKSATTPTVDHFYPLNGPSQIFPVLRIKDANGFIADTIVELENATGSADLAASSPTPKPTSNTQPPWALIAGLIALVVITLGVLQKTRARRSARGRYRGTHQ